MAIAQLGHLGERACRLWLDPTQDRARSTARVDEFLDEPITRELIDGILDAISRDPVDNRASPRPQRARCAVRRDQAHTIA